MPGTRARYIGILALAAGAILLVGSLARPVRQASKAAAPTEDEMARLARLAQRRAVEDFGAYFAAAADLAAPSLVRIDASGATGVIWRPGLVVTPHLPAARLPDTVAVTSGAARREARVFARGPNLPLVALDAPDLPEAAASRRSPATLRADEWVIAAWRTSAGRTFASGQFVAVTTATAGTRSRVVTSVALTPAMAGGGLFDLDGQLIAVIAHDSEGMVAYAPDSVDAIIAAGTTVQARIVDRYGLGLSELTPETVAVLQIDHGVLVREVWDDSQADRAGLRPGDVITALGDAPVNTLNDLATLGGPQLPAPPTLTLQWRRTTRTSTLGAEASSPPSGTAITGAGLVWASAPAGQRVDAVAPESRAARAGLEAGDVVLAVNRATPASAAQISRALASPAAAPVFLEVRRGGRRLGVIF
jgi:serine protease DegQ